MCGGSAFKFNTPKPMIKIGKEMLIERTLRLLKEEGVEDIAISSTDYRFENFGVPLLTHYNPVFNACDYHWLYAFYPMKEPVCYIYGDVFFSPEAIHTIVTTQTDDIEFFASAPPFSKEYVRSWAEPFGFKVTNTKRFFECINRAIELERKGLFRREAISWELWQVIKDTPINEIVYDNYTAINDYTVDIDDNSDIRILRALEERISNA